MQSATSSPISGSSFWWLDIIAGILRLELCHGSFITFPLPDSLSTSLTLVISGCKKEVLGIENQLRVSSTGYARVIRWPVSGRGEMNKRGGSLEAYKAALNMDILVTQL